MSAALLLAILRNPASVATLPSEAWNGLIAAARAERLIGTLAYRLDGVAVPPAILPVLADARFEAEREARQALWEADRARVALAHLDVPVVLLKGTAYAAAGLAAGRGRFIGDLDILVPREALDAVEAALLAAGWEWVKPDPYDDAYYRQWMHELPPLIHRERDRMIDVHHTILPLTARQTPDAAAMIADSVRLEDGSRVLSTEDRICHAAAHMLADGDLAGGLRNLWDIYCLLGESPEAAALEARAAVHGLGRHVAQAVRLARHVFGPGEAVTSTIGPRGSPAHAGVQSPRFGMGPGLGRGTARLRFGDRLIIARLLARNGWGQETRWALRFGFYARSHWLRMPPAMLARHLITKWRKGHKPR